MQDVLQEASLPIMLANVDCDDNATSLLQCSQSPSDFRHCVFESAVQRTRLACTRAVESAPLSLPGTAETQAAIPIGQLHVR